MSYISDFAMFITHAKKVKDFSVCGVGVLWQSDADFNGYTEYMFRFHQDDKDEKIRKTVSIIFID